MDIQPGSALPLWKQMLAKMPARLTELITDFERMQWERDRAQAPND